MRNMLRKGRRACTHSNCCAPPCKLGHPRGLQDAPPSPAEAVRERNEWKERKGRKKGKEEKIEKDGVLPHYPRCASLHSANMRMCDCLQAMAGEADGGQSREGGEEEEI